MENNGPKSTNKWNILGRIKDTFMGCSITLFTFTHLYLHFVFEIRLGYRVFFYTTTRFIQQSHPIIAGLFNIIHGITFVFPIFQSSSVVKKVANMWIVDLSNLFVIAFADISMLASI